MPVVPSDHQPSDVNIRCNQSCHIKKQTFTNAHHRTSSFITTGVVVLPGPKWRAKHQECQTSRVPNIKVPNIKSAKQGRRPRGGLGSTVPPKFEVGVTPMHWSP